MLLPMPYEPANLERLERKQIKSTFIIIALATSARYLMFIFACRNLCFFIANLTVCGCPAQCLAGGAIQATTADNLIYDTCCTMFYLDRYKIQEVFRKGVMTTRTIKGEI